VPSSSTHDLDRRESPRTAADRRGSARLAVRGRADAMPDYITLALVVPFTEPDCAVTVTVPAAKP
jgi:hypothetical protein